MTRWDLLAQFALEVAVGLVVGTAIAVAIVKWERRGR